MQSQLTDSLSRPNYLLLILSVKRANGGLGTQGIVDVSPCVHSRLPGFRGLQLMQVNLCVGCAATDNGYDHGRKLLWMRLLRIGSTPSPQLQREQAFVGSDVAARVRRTTVTSSERVTGVIIIIVNPSPSTCRWPRCHLPTPRPVLRRRRRRCCRVRMT
jgi:hypothetical protein